MPPKKYRRNNPSYTHIIRRPARSARKSKLPDLKETLSPAEQSKPSIVTPQNPETPSQTSPNSTPYQQVTPTVIDLTQSPEGEIYKSNVQDCSEQSKNEAPAEKQNGEDGVDGKSAGELKNPVKKKKTRIVKRIVKRKVLRKVSHEKAEVVNGGGVSGNVSVDGFEASPTCIVGERQEGLEVFEDVKHCDKNLKSSDGTNTDAVVMQNMSGSCVEGRVNCSSTEDVSKVPGLDVDVADEKAGSVSGTQLEDCIDNDFQGQNHDNMAENNLDSETGGRRQEEGVENNLEGVENNQEFGSEVDKKEEGVNSKEECSDFGEVKAETTEGGVILSAEMGALDRRMRRKTEIFVGGLDKDTKEDDIRKIFEVLGEIKDVTLVNSRKTKNTFAFVRYALAADAKKALINYRKVEICGRLCGTSPVEGNDTLFLGNIDKRWKSDDVTKLLLGNGIEKIDHITVMSDPNNIELNRGFAFIELESIKDAQNAYKKLQKKGVLGKHLKVAWAEPLIEPDESELNKVKSVYAEYLPSSWDEQKVKDCFKRFGDIENVALARDMPSSRRKDFAFVNYTTRDAALACVEAFSSEQINDKGSKVKVSLAKPFPKGQQIKHLRTTPTSEFKEKQKRTPLVKNPQESRIARNPTSNYDTGIVDQRSSMNSGLLQLLREQASMRPTILSSNAGFVNREYPYSLPGRKRLFPVQGDGSQFSDPRGHPRARVDGSYPITNPSVSTRSVSMSSLPYHQQGSNYISGPVYGMERRPTYFQPRERAPYHGNIGTYRRY